jgi:hypothetical protein
MRLWVVQMHDDPHDFKPVFVESAEPPYFNAPAVTLGSYIYSDRGWIWEQLRSVQLDAGLLEHNK